MATYVYVSKTPEFYSNCFLTSMCKPVERKFFNQYLGCTTWTGICQLFILEATLRETHHHFILNGF